MSDTRPTLFVSDLHLPPETSPLRQRFLRFLDGPAREAAAVYILGDLFESWIGDDIGLLQYAPEVAALSALTARGIPVYFQHGNRDFIVGRDFFDLTGIAELPDPHRVDLHGTPTLVSHGDLYCTDDRAYQRWRRFSRIRFAQRVFLMLPRARRERIAGGLRSGSDRAKQNKAENIMDVNPGAIRGGMAQAGVRRIIHGHTHRPGTYDVELPIGAAQRIVLPDWRDDSCDYLRIDADGITRQAAPA
ncbi:UDP-2,3-diacylglucosamine diphosphatase [Panacagrimonas perspica]|nr:UDP-2,3-diacylglucosamine diphosphatase [Panacagrimonas perspica]THD01987.1 UDP-2,3-diacylglucosamine diphosphatase [Panacagrimonas perspica]